MPTLRPLVCAAALALSPSIPVHAQTDSSLLTLDRIFASDEFTPELPRRRPLARGRARLHQARGRQRGHGHARAGALRRRDRPSRGLGARRAAGPAGDSAPLPIEDYNVSPDRKRLLLFTNSQKVWRQNTRGDFWTLDLSTWQLRKLGGPDAAPSTLMFAKFSPDGGRVAYVREHDLYVENLARRPHHAAHRVTARAPSSTAPSTGYTRRSSTCATGSAGAPTAGGSPSGSSTPPGCGTST